MASVTTEVLREILDPAVRSAGLLLEDASATQAGRRTVVGAIVDLPDGPGGVTSDQLADATRAISAALDKADPIKGTYTLEVSTPGIDRPLTSPRHFRRAIGRLVQLTAAGATVKGKVAAADDESVTVDGQTIKIADITWAQMLVDFGGEA